MLRATPTGVGSVEYLTTLVYELLDAHEDTTRLAAGLIGDPEWAAHADYLRCLQRLGREALAAGLSPSAAEHADEGLFAGGVTATREGDPAGKRRRRRIGKGVR
jgi:hypothetical protein